MLRRVCQRSVCGRGHGVRRSQVASLLSSSSSSLFDCCSSGRGLHSLAASVVVGYNYPLRPRAAAGSEQCSLAKTCVNSLGGTRPRLVCTSMSSTNVFVKLIPAAAAAATSPCPMNFDLRNKSEYYYFPLSTSSSVFDYTLANCFSRV